MGFTTTPLIRLSKMPIVLTILLLLSSISLVHGDPIGPPNLNECRSQCCIPLPKKKTLKFSFDLYPRVQRVRAPAHLADETYIEKYGRAYEIMKSLPEDDPRSLIQQANIHCAMCAGGYFQPGTDARLHIHWSWLFLPWHRWFLYFHERILASLIGDPDFSLPFWNWDNQIDGNSMPYFFNYQDSALYDPNRDPNHVPPALVELTGGSKTRTKSEIVAYNLKEIYDDVVVPYTAESFMGGAFRLGDSYSSISAQRRIIGGVLDTTLHSVVHMWVGDPSQPGGMDMGTSRTSARDPIFYPHHANVDRLWDVWQTSLPSGPRQVFSDSDFHDSSFVFYDENANLVEVTIHDCLDNEKLGIRYTKVDADKLWMHYNPSRHTFMHP